MKNHISQSFGSFLKTVFFDSPMYLVAELTGKCNARCQMCSIWKTFDFRDASAEKYIETINFFEKEGAKIAFLTGGEPLLRKDLGRIMQNINTINILTTNGFLLSEKISGISENCDFVFVSLDSPIAEEHDKIRGVKGCFEKVIEGIKKTKEIGIPVHIVMTVMDFTLDKVEEMCRLAKEHNCLVSTNYLISLNNNYNKKTAYFNNENKPAPLPDYIETAKRMRKKYNNFITTDFELNLLKRGGNSIKTPVCKGTRTVVGIKPDCSIAFPCTHYPERYLSKEEWKKEKPCGGNMPVCDNCTIKCYILPSIVSQPKKWFTTFSPRDALQIIGNSRMF